MKKKYKKMQLGGFLAPISINDMMDAMSNLSIPQKLATKAVTGKYQTPSEAMGIKNKAGAFATDMILDPINLFSAAGITKGIASKLPPKQTQQIVKGSVNWWDNHPAFKKNNPNMTPEQYVNNTGKFGNYTIDDIDPSLIPFDKRTLTKEQYKNFMSDQRLRVRRRDIDPFDSFNKNKKKKSGGPIIDPMGQWSHPGKHTIVPTKDGLITMKGVSYPVFGQDETGYTQMMMPGGEYSFPGKTIYEVPMKQQGGQFFRDIMLNKHQAGDQVNLIGAPNSFAWNPFGNQNPPLPVLTGQSMYRIDQTPGTPVKQDPIVPIQQGKQPGEWIPKTTTSWQPNVEGAGMVLGAMGMISNQMNNVHNSKIYNNSINRATTDAQFSTFNPILKRGYTDQNSGRMAPDNQTLSQFTNKPAPSYYGMLPTAQMGGLPDMNIPNDPTFSIDALVDKGLPPLPTSFIPSMAPSSIPSLAPSKVSIDDAEFLTYMAHQQGEAGIKAITKAARSGQDWREFYKGKENLDTNMRSNINQQEFFKKYDSLNPATFLDYWKNKFNKQSSKWGKKSTQYDGLIEQAAPQFGLNPSFVKTVIGIESGFDSNATNGSHKGLLQLNDKEARKRGVKDPYNPVENILAGLQMMAQRRDRLAKMSFKEGGEYDLSMEEVDRLRKLGYDVEEIS